MNCYAQGTPQAADIREQLIAACNGIPYAQVRWPHRLLHDAVAEIDYLRDQLHSLLSPGGTYTFGPDRPAVGPNPYETDRWETRCDLCGNKPSLGRSRNLRCYCGGFCRDIPDECGRT